MAKSADLDLDLHYLQRQGISRFSRTRVKTGPDSVIIFAESVIHINSYLFCQVIVDCSIAF